jgi:hypothetical protein
MKTTMNPSLQDADRAVSAKVFMPLCDDKLLVLAGKPLGV